jgi:hypothetical protein
MMTLWALFYGSPQSLVDSFHEKILEVFVFKLAKLFFFYIEKIIKKFKSDEQTCAYQRY